jgi:uncharacterized protein YecT (DUF1311 family)
MTVREITYAAPVLCKLNNGAASKEASRFAQTGPIESTSTSLRLPDTCVNLRLAEGETVLGGVFISYRREDSGGFAGRIYDRLGGALGRENVFFDVDSIAPGIDFVDALSKRVGRCDALIAVIGKHWVSTTDADNRRRLDDPSDFVRVEIEAAIKRGVRVIPVLVDGANLPKSDDLPRSLKTLTRRQAIEISHARFDSDVERLNHALSELEIELSAGGVTDSATIDASPPTRANPLAARRSMPLYGLAQPQAGDAKTHGVSFPMVAAIAAASVTVAAGFFFVEMRRSAPHPWKPGFDCRLASSKVESWICDNEELSQVDAELNIIYDTVRKPIGLEDQKRLEDEERIWVADRNTCSSFDCIKKHYDGRISTLKTIVNDRR